MPERESGHSHQTVLEGVIFCTAVHMQLKGKEASFT